jgi:protein SCO1/2
MKGKKGVLGLILILLVPSALYIFFSTGRHNIITLPIFGEREVIVNTVDGKEQTDTVYHTIPPFNFIDEDGKSFGSTNLENKFYVAAYFFTQCPSICKDMSTNLKYLSGRVADFKDVEIVSFSCDPERDTVEALKEYAQRYEYTSGQWHFLTGNKDSLYTLAIKGFLIPTSEDVLAPGGFLHSEQFVLIDKKKRIRGFYDGTNLREVKRLIDEIKVLKAEAQIVRKKKK